MKKIFIPVLLGVSLLCPFSFAQAPQKCPAVIVLSSSNKTSIPPAEFDGIIQKTFEKTFGKKLGGQIVLATKDGDFLLTISLASEAGKTFFSAALTDVRIKQVLGNASQTYGSSDFKRLFQADLETAFEKFASALASKIRCPAPVAGANLCLVFSGKSVAEIKDSETGLKFDWRSANEGNVPLFLDEASGMITGKGTMRPTTTAQMDVSKMPASGRGGTSAKAVPVTVSGKLVGETAKLHIAGTTVQSFPFHVQAAGEQLPDVPYTSSAFVTDIEIPFREGGRKKESRVQKPTPGYDITQTIDYDFLLKSCGK